MSGVELGPLLAVFRSPAVWGPVAAAGVGALLGWRFHRSKVVLAQLCVAAAAWGLALPAAGSPAATAALLAAAAVLPLVLVVLFVRREVGLLSIAFLLRLASLGALVLALGAAGQTLGAAPVLRWLQWLPAEWAGALPLAPLSAGGLLVTLAAGLALSLWRGPEPRLLALAFAATALVLGLGLQAGVVVGSAGLPALVLGGGSVALSLGVVQLGYRLAYRDALTGLPGRRALEEEFDRLRAPFVVAMADVDHFKRFNDRHGHEVGDQVLKLVASRLAKVGAGGRSFRYGGEEFCVVFPGQAEEPARAAMEGLRAAIEDSRLTLRSARRPRKKPAQPKPTRGRRPQVSVTVSVGVAAVAGGQKQEPRAAVADADRNLYRAKAQGRNRVV